MISFFMSHEQKSSITFGGYDESVIKEGEED